MPQHCTKRDDARSAGDQQDWTAECWRPNEISADRSAKLELITHGENIEEIWRYFAVVETLDREHEVVILGRRRVRIASLRLIAVGCGETNIHVLSCLMPRPIRAVEHETSDARGLNDDLDDLRDSPVQSPW